MGVSLTSPAFYQEHRLSQTSSWLISLCVSLALTDSHNLPRQFLAKENEIVYYSVIIYLCDVWIN